jgi:CCR4-NOT transcription complex subunit 6
MYNQNHAAHQGHNMMMNGGAGHRGFVQMNMNKPFQQHNQAHQHHGHGHQQHQEHNAGTHGGQYNHQHNLSGGGLANTQPHYAAGHLQNGTPGSVHSGLSKPPNEHWAEQLNLAQKSREMTQSHAYARANQAASKSILAGSANGTQDEKEERNRPVANRVEAAKKNRIWTAMDISGQNLKVINSVVFRYEFLTQLYLNCNKLTYIPPTIGKLRTLTHLDLSLNELRFLPPEMGMLVNMKQLLLFDNHLENLPYELGSMYQLEMLGIEGNPIPEDLKSIIVESGTTELIKYFRENAEGMCVGMSLLLLKLTSYRSPSAART